MIEFHKPDLRFYKDTSADPNQGRLVLEPLQKGYGQTLGHAIRTVLVSLMPGACISKMKVEGVAHRFSSVDGVADRVRHIILNLSKVIVKCADPAGGPYTLRLQWPAPGQDAPTGEGEWPVTAQYITGDALRADGGEPPVTIINPDAHIFTATSARARVDMTLVIENGRGFHLGDPSHDKDGFLVLNRHFSPVIRCEYEIEDARVGQDINFDRLTLDVLTNGAILPELAVKHAADLVRQRIHPLVGVPVASEFPEESFVMIKEEKKVENKNLDISIKELEFSVRSRNCLEQENIRTLGELAKKRASELLAIKNFGKKSLNEIRDKLHQYGLSLADEEPGKIPLQAFDDDDEEDDILDDLNDLREDDGSDPGTDTTDDV